MHREEDAVICRCEEITLGEIRQSIAEGCKTINEIKYRTRAGMGPCQGRTCKMLIAQEICKAYNLPIEEVMMPAFRIPTEPISIDAMANACKNDRGTNS